MNDTIILTCKPEESIILRERLAYNDMSLRSVPAYTKKDLTVMKECRYIFSTWYMPSFTENEINTLFPKLEAIFYAAGTVKNFAEPFLRRGIKIFSAAEANGIPVAEYTAAQIILANKGFFQASRGFKWPMSRWGYGKLRKSAQSHLGNYETTVGLLGCGAVGSKVVELLRQYDIKVKVYDPYLTDERIKILGVTSTSLKNIFSTCDVISNHLPDIQPTKGIINRDLLELLKPYATFINTGRGAQIVETDLCRILRKRKDLTAILDVTAHEPPYPWSQLYRLKNVFLTPHLAGSAGNEIKRMVDFIYNSYKAFRDGDNPQGEIMLNQLKIKA